MYKPGDHIDAWVVEKPIGSGGMGTVFRCRNRHAARILAAIKTLDPALVRQVPEVHLRFVREAEILYSLDHPNVVKVRNVRLDVAIPYLEMEFVEGESLETRLCRGPLPLARAIDLMGQLLSAIGYLHDQGICHRDIKPSNLLIDKEGRLRLVDFGLAAEIDVSRITRQNTTFGTVSYAPPEWIHPDKLDPEHWDLYAAGVVFWEALTGRVAFPGSPHVDPRQQAIQIMALKQSHPPLDPGAGYRDDVRALCRDMTVADRSKRVTDARVALQRIRKLDASPTPPPANSVSLPGAVRRPKSSSTPGSVGSPTGSVPRRPKSPKSRPRGLGSWAVLALGGVGGIGVFLGVVIVGLIAIAVLLDRPVPEARPVNVMIAGLPRGTDVALKLGDQVPTSVDGFLYHFSQAPVGTAEIAWSVGSECGVPACPGDACPLWCETGVARYDVVPGMSPQQINLELVPPEARQVRVDASTVPVEGRLRGDLGVGRDGIADGGTLLFPGVAPGPYLLTLEVGACPAEAAGCYSSPNGRCPPGCASYKGEIVVKAGADEALFRIPSRAVAPVAAATLAAVVPSIPTASQKRRSASMATMDTSSVAVAPVEASVEPTPAKPAAKAGALVSKSEFSRWLEKNPKWTRLEAQARGNADANYLSGWNGGKPPGKGSEPVSSVSWAAASAFCQERGGLASFDAEPLTWERSGASAEWRSRSGNPAVRRSDGTGNDVRIAESNATTGFRCAR